MAAPLLQLVDNHEELEPSDGINVFEVPPLGTGFTEEVSGKHRTPYLEKSSVILTLNFPACVNLFLFVSVFISMFVAYWKSRSEARSVRK